MNKYLQRKLDSMKWPQLLIFEEKHCTTYYLCKDKEAVGLACLAVLKQRLHPRDGYIQHPGPEDKIYGLKEEVTKEVAESLPETYRKHALRIITENAKLRAEWKKDVEIFENAKKAVKNKNGELAFEVLSDRCDYEYESYTFEEPIIP